MYKFLKLTLVTLLGVMIWGMINLSLAIPTASTHLATQLLKQN